MMKIFDKVCGKMGLLNPEGEEGREDERERVSMENSLPRPDNVVNISTAANSKFSRMKVVVIEPRSFDDVQQVANCFKEKKPVVINFENTDAEDAKRIIDFISGTTYALVGDIKYAPTGESSAWAASASVEAPATRAVPDKGDSTNRY